MKFKAKKGDRLSKNFEDRRHLEPYIAPSAPDALLRGLPQTPHEMHLYKQAIARNEAYKAGTPLPPEPAPFWPALAPQVGPGDPAGIEARRAALARYQAEQAQPAAISPEQLRQGLLDEQRRRTTRRPGGV